ncbi:hypothetical protein D5086_016648 [Populus alba]|uniref:Uncharacterized protein n=1 Tax=Populus alba TaxID=43335 RepID=A0ACC4BVT1_POPAL
MYRKCKVVHCHGMVGAGGPYLPIFLAHHPQLHVETPFPSSHALYLMVVHVGTNENDLHECIKATLCHIFVPVPSSTITVKKLVSESHGCKSTNLRLHFQNHISVVWKGKVKLNRKWIDFGAVSHRNGVRDLHKWKTTGNTYRKMPISLYICYLLDRLEPSEALLLETHHDGPVLSSRR